MFTRETLESLGWAESSVPGIWILRPYMLNNKNGFITFGIERLGQGYYLTTVDQLIKATCDY